MADGRENPSELAAEFAGADRRTDERRASQRPLNGNDRRVADRRSGADRRAVSRTRPAP